MVTTPLWHKGIKGSNPFASTLKTNERQVMSTDPRPSKKEWAINLARAVAKRADCTRRQVGAVTFDKDFRVISTGYNGAPSGKPGCLSDGACPRGKMSKTDVVPGSSYDTGAGSCIAIHAEANAIMFADPVRRVGGTMYVTDEPCDGCMKFIEGSGLIAVYWPEGQWNK